jgi:hypothetical protein
MALVLAILPAAAVAKPDGIIGNSILTGFELRGSNGYRIQVLTVGRQFALLGASKGQVAASYAVRGKFSANRIKARFGSLGRISVRFVPSSPPRDKGSQSQCGGPIDLIGAKGTFRGTIKFRGEQGYTKVDSGSARGVVLGIGQEACSARFAAPSAAFPLTGLTTHLTAIAKKAGKVFSLDAFGFGNDDQISLSASLQERRPRMDIFRVASTVVGGENAFVSTGVDKHPATATLKPPKPFSGTGVFQESQPLQGSQPLSVSWRGSIAAWLPGAGRVRMAGPKFASSLCRQSLKGDGCNLFPTVQRDFQMAQESGSQSHALREVMLSWSKYLLKSASSAGSTP